MRVPLFATTLEPHHERLVEAVARVVRSGRYILGPEVAAFEEEFARYLGVEHCVGVANGTDALTIALRALGRRPARRTRDSGPDRSARRPPSRSSRPRTCPASATAGRSRPTTRPSRTALA